jgi:hypothetical protein
MTSFAKVLRQAAHWILLWSYLLLEDQREHMVIGCNQMLTVAQDFFFKATGWRHINRIKDGYSILLLCVFIWLIYVSTLADP